MKLKDTRSLEECLPSRHNHYFLLLFSRSVVSDSCDLMECSTPGFPVLYHFLAFAQTHVHWVSDAISPSHLLFPPSQLGLNYCLSIVASSIVAPYSQSFPASGLSSNESTLCTTRWPKYWSLSLNISTSNKYSVLISLMVDWFDLLVVQGTLKSIFQHHNLKASIDWNFLWKYKGRVETHETGWDLGRRTLYRNACTCSSIFSSNKTQRDYKV